jgi:hypothetical protein
MFRSGSNKSPPEREKYRNGGANAEEQVRQGKRQGGRRERHV